MTRGSVLAKHADHAALNFYVTRGNDDRLHFAIRGLETNFSAGLAVKAFQGGVSAADQSDHDFAGIGDLRRFHDDIIAIEDVIVAIELPFHLQDVTVSAAREFAEGKCFAIFDRLPAVGRRRCVPSWEFQSWRLGDLFAHWLGKLLHFNGAALIVSAANVTLFLERGDVLVHRRERI